ncbi:GAF and ANTAR domain-containing protein [Prauserella flavalba]|uniref:Transcriptional regulator n=1 Tax=Prauserella flavalba TaxID=1477506 RepID=A0A318LND9_9PSEU|nr:GAF and ANTAR domain-containing protein [Prauserella flavalba]PXY28606.1 transcriptional regulator [Prauserella flavalba]
MTASQRQVAHVFVELADTLVDDFDLLAFLHLLATRCKDTLEVDAVGVLLADHNGTLNTVAASSERARLLELFQLQNDEGPCLDCYRGAAPVHAADLAAERGRWPRFVAVAEAEGFASSHALPLRLRDDVIGALNIFGTRPGRLADELLAIGQALADIATIGILQERTARDRGLLARQLQAALDSRILIEQAKGVLSERLGSGVDEAFAVLRDYARSHNRRLREVARAVVDNDPGVTDIA